MTPFRPLLGCVAIATGVFFLSLPASADTPELPKESYKKAAEADLTFLQTRLAELAGKEAAGKKILDGQVKPALGVALLLAAYADPLGDAALKADALKVAEAIARKDFKTADALAKKLTVMPGAAGKTAALPKPFQDELMLAATMTPFRGKQVGGLNIDRDIKDMTKANMPTKIDPAAVEILAVRTAVILAYAEHLPGERAKAKPEKLRSWEVRNRRGVEVSQQLAEEAAKGAKADEKKLKTLLSNLNGRCTACHTTDGRGD